MTSVRKKISQCVWGVEHHHHHPNQHPRHNLLRSISLLDMPLTSPCQHCLIWIFISMHMRAKILFYGTHSEIVCVVNIKSSYRARNIMAVGNIMIVGTGTNARVLVSMIDASVAVLARVICAEINLLGEIEKNIEELKLIDVACTLSYLYVTALALISLRALTWKASDVINTLSAIQARIRVALVVLKVT